MSGGPKTTTDTSGSTSANKTGTTLSNTTGLQQTNSTTNNYGVSDTAATTANQGSTSTAGYQANQAYAPAEPVLQGILGQAGNMLDQTGLTSGEQGAIQGITDQGQANTALAPDLQAGAQRLLTEGVGQGDDDMIREGHDASKAALEGYARGDHLDFNNPYLQTMLSGVKDDITNSVGAQFAGAGRSFSGAHANTLAKGISSGMAAQLLPWYTGQQDRQFAAANALTGNANAASGALANSNAGMLQSMLAAPQLLDATYSPYTQQLAAQQYGRNAPVGMLAQLSDITMPSAQAFGSSFNLGQGDTRDTGQSLSTTRDQSTSSTASNTLNRSNTMAMLESLMSGNQTGKSVTEQENDPLQTMLGAAALGLGAYKAFG